MIGPGMKFDSSGGFLYHSDMLYAPWWEGREVSYEYSGSVDLMSADDRVFSAGATLQAVVVDGFHLMGDELKKFLDAAREVGFISPKITLHEAGFTPIIHTYESKEMAMEEGRATAIVAKLKHESMAVCLNNSERGYFKLGTVFTDKRFDKFAYGDVLIATGIWVEDADPKFFTVTKRNTPYLAKDVDIPMLIKKTDEMLDLEDERNRNEEQKIILGGQQMERGEDPRIKGYYINQEARLIFTSAKVLSDAKPQRAVKLMMVGPSGYGKTTLPFLFSQMAEMEFLYMNCASIRDPEEWFGYREARDGSTVFIRSAFIEKVQEGNCVVVLDEFNRLEPWLHNTLFPLLDDRGKTVVHDEEFSIGPGVIIVGTINSGYKYTGTFELDEALLNRFDFTLEVGPMPHEEEVKVLTTQTPVTARVADQIVKMANSLRTANIVCSTRTTIRMAEMVGGGMKVREAFESAVIKRIPSDGSNGGQRKAALDLIVTRIGVLEERNLTNDIFAGAYVKGEDRMERTEFVVEEKAVADTCSLNLRKASSGVPFLKVQAINEMGSLIVMGKPMPIKSRNEIVMKVKDGNTVLIEDVLKDMDILEGVIERLKLFGIDADIR